MASSSTKQDLQAEFLAAAEALFAVTQDGTEIYHLIHEVVHKPQAPSRKTSSSADISPHVRTMASKAGKKVDLKTSVYKPKPDPAAKSTPPKSAATPSPPKSATKQTPFEPAAKRSSPKSATKPSPLKSIKRSSSPKSTRQFQTPVKPKKSAIRHATPEDNVTPELSTDDIEMILNAHFPIDPLPLPSPTKKRGSSFNDSVTKKPKKETARETPLSDQKKKNHRTAK